MSFRRRVVILSAGAVAAAIVVACVPVYVLTAGQLNSQLDQSLRDTLIPGKTQAVRVQATFERAKLEQLTREGRLGPKLGVPAAGFGSAAGQASGATARLAPAAALRSV